MTPENHKIVKGEILSFVLDNDLGQLDQLHAMVTSFGHVHGLDKKAVFETSLVLEEIFTNIISYGHEDKNRHQVHFFLKSKNDSIEIRIEDDGQPFNLLKVDPADLDTDLDHRSVGGLGIHLVQKIMDDINYERINTKNVVTMRKKTRKKEVE